MKKTLAVVVVMLLALTLCVSLIACNGGLEGTYKFESITIGDKTYKAGEEVEVTPGISMKMDADYMTLTLEADKTAKMVTKALGQEVSVNGTWEEKDGNVVITVNGDAQTFKVESGKLVVEQDGQKLVLAK